ncbi:MAG: permease-like cell division protein FtsX, partial [Solobacterium sp.]|nr:permease-like cell division protein FtsX [Solobacterium sp.]
MWRPIKEGFLGVFRHGAMSVSAAVAVTLTLIIISLFMMFTMNVGQLTQGIEQSVQISATVEYGKESAENEDRISLAIQEIPGVDTVTYSSKADEFQYYLNSFSDEKTREAFKPFEGENNPMHDAFYVTVKDGTTLESVANQISQIDGIEAVNFGGSSAITLISMLRTIRYGGGMLALALSLLAIFLIQNTIKLTIMARADEIAIMRNVGARNGFIRAPFLVEGIIIGALGAIIPIILTWYGYTWAYNLSGGYLISQMFKLIPPSQFVGKASLTLLLIGVLVGLIGSFLSVTKYLRW